MSQEKDTYTESHLVVAAMRVLEHQKSVPATVDDVSGLLGLSREQISFICKRLGDLGIIEPVEGAYGTRLFLRDHLKLEEIPRGIRESGMEKELKKYQEEKKQLSRKVESFRVEEAGRKKSLFADIEKKLKEGLDKKSG